MNDITTTSDNDDRLSYIIDDESNNGTNLFQETKQFLNELKPILVNKVRMSFVGIVKDR